MPLPSPYDYDDWRDFASALLSSLSDGTGDVIASGGGGGGGGLLAPPGYQPVWSDISNNQLYYGNGFLTVPTAPDIVAVDTINLALLSVDGNILADGVVSSAKILDATILSADIGDLQVVTAKINDLAVNNAKIANLAVDSAKIANLAVGTAHIQNAAITNAQIANATILTANIANAQITNALVANAAIGSAQIIDASILTADIGSAQITSALIADATIVTADIGSAQITNALIANATILTADIASAQITSALIANGTIATADIGAAQITTALIANLAVGSAQIADLAVGTLKIAGNSVTTNKTDYGVGGNSSAFFDSNNTVNFSSTVAYTNIASVTLTSEQGMVIEGFFSCVLIDTGGTISRINFQLIRDDGAVILNPQLFDVRDEGHSLAFGWLDAVDAGRTTTWTVQMIQTEAENIAVKPRFMKVTEHVRQFFENISLAAPAGQGPGQGTAGGGNINGTGAQLRDYY